MKNNKILLICGGGGFSWEGKILSEELRSNGASVILTYPVSSYENRKYFVENLAYFTKSITHRSGYSIKNLILGFIYNYKLTSRIIIEQNCKLVIGVGTSGAIPMLLAARFHRARVIFVESITRTRELSRTCKIISLLSLADEILVQWENLSDETKHIYYRGSII